MKIVSSLHPELNVPVVIVVHRKAGEENLLEDILQFKCQLKVKEIEDKMPIKKNQVYLAPANYHLFIEKENYFALDDSEKVNYSRPNIDVTMESIVETYQGKVIGILLTGANNDGSLGMKMIHEAGGFTIIQSPESCDYPAMPSFASEVCQPDLSLDPEGIGSYLKQLKN